MSERERRHLSAVAVIRALAVASSTAVGRDLEAAPLPPHLQGLLQADDANAPR
jgi:hypothetical protein